MAHFLNDELPPTARIVESGRVAIFLKNKSAEYADKEAKEQNLNLNLLTNLSTAEISNFQQNQLNNRETE